MSIAKKYGYTWITVLLFIGSLAGHWALTWKAYANEERDKGKQPEVSEYLIITGRDTLENWQSEFLQLFWQVAGLAFLLHIGSPQSKEGDDRLEEKVDFLIRKLAPGECEQLFEECQKKFPKPKHDAAE